MLSHTDGGRHADCHSRPVKLGFGRRECAEGQCDDCHRDGGSMGQVIKAWWVVGAA